tara:strand:- start:749 stop:1099 length:351 start_codon:yes stop_codon:yes gene_type:complete
MGLGHGISSERGKNKATKLDTYRSNQTTRTIISVPPGGTSKADATACGYSGLMISATMLGPGTTPQVGFEITQYDPPTYTPLVVNGLYPRFKTSVGGINYSLTLDENAVVTNVYQC